MNNTLIQRHREMMSILDYCNEVNPNRDLLRILQGLRIDCNGKPNNKDMFDYWIKVTEQTMDKNIIDFVIIFLEKMQGKSMPLLENAISIVRLLPHEKIVQLQSVQVNYWNRSAIKITQDYKDMLKILDHCYYQTYNDDLGDLLGSLSIGIWADRLPADLADYEIWLNSVENIKERDIVTKIVTFLNRFGSEFKTYDLAPTISFVESLSEEQIKKITQSSSSM